MTERPPGLTHYNERAAGLGLVAGSGAPLSFVPPDDLDLSYEKRVFERGEVVTRPDNWHDAYNAEVWLEFPLSKAALNHRHLQAMADERPGQRGRVRDRITQFDECGVVITGLREELWQALCAHRWRTVFVDHRRELIDSVKFHYFGHATRDTLRAPFFGVCGKAMWLGGLDGGFTDQHRLDHALCRRLTSADFMTPWQPLPLLGIPGVTAASEDPAYYDDERQFRPVRALLTTMPAGSPPGNR